MKKGLILTSNFPKDCTTSTFISRLFSNKSIQEYMELFILAPHTHKSLFHDELYGFHVFRFPYFFPFKFQKLAYGGGMPYNFKSSFFAKVQVPTFFLFELIYTMLLVKKKNVDFINSHWLIPQGIVGAICKKVLGVPHISTIHSSEITLFKNLPMKTKIADFIISNSDFIISASAHRANEFLSISSSKYRNIAKDKINVIPMGVNVKKFDIHIDKDSLKVEYGISAKYVLLFIGRLVEVKGCEYLIKAFRKVVDSFENTQLIIVGRGPLESRLKDEASRLNLTEHVRFEGFVNNDIVPNYYKMADIVVIPSIVDSSGFEEGFPVVAMEALVAGKPIVSTKTKGLMEIIQDRYNGLLVEPQDPEKISCAIIRFLENECFREEISRNALESGKKYDWDLIADKYIQLINKVAPKSEFNN